MVTFHCLSAPRATVSLSILVALVALSVALTAAISTSDHQQHQTGSNLGAHRSAQNGSRATTASWTKRRASGKQAPSATRRPQVSASGGGSGSNSQADPFALAQQQAKLMLGYNNTPPLFVTSSRDLFVDVARFSPGAKLTTMKAIDMDGDRLEYSLQPASLRDASSYFAIEPTSGELRLANKSFQTDLSTKRESFDQTSSDFPDETPDDSAGGAEQEQAEQEQEQEPTINFNKNLYFLNVAVDDGTQMSVIELQVHVINSSSIAALQGASSPVQLTPDGSRRASEQMEELIRRKTSLFYDKLHKTIQTANSSSYQAVVYPNFINPALVRPTKDERPSTIATLQTTTLAYMDEDTTLATTVATDINNQQASTSQPTGQLLVQIAPVHSRTPAELSGSQINRTDSALISQQMIVTLVIVCSCLTIVLVLLMFIVPISVKQLRKRLKHVEQQHQHLSQQTSHGSSTVCSSSSSSSGSVVTHNHGPWLSQFTLGSDVSSSHRDHRSVCHQSSLDSNITAMTTKAQTHHYAQGTQARAELVPNPSYLQQRQYFAHPDTLNCLVAGMQHQSNGRAIGSNNEANKCDNVYYPIDDPNDSFYSTINTESTTITGTLSQAAFPGAKNQAINGQSYLGMVHYGPPDMLAMERPIESPGSDSGSSTRSLARFLSLPARQGRRAMPITSDFELPDDELLDTCDKHPTQQTTSKTIARTSHVEREQHDTKWELERHRLKFLDILDQGQFGLVWRCILKRSNNDEQIVAVKTLKSSNSRDERGREDLLAEMEIMKRVCYHPNVIKILHCCTTNVFQVNESKPIFLVMEYAELGKLQSFLENSRKNHHYATSNLLTEDARAPNDHLTSRDLIKFIYHIAKGMEYIASQCIVHRDLASRNILVSAHKICKIGDFGMARHVQSLGDIYERHSRNSKIPVRWMAPEVLLSNKFTTKSDVFSFGILMWEIVTLGSTPYRHLKTDQVIEEVARAGERPVKPEHCHAQLYKIMSTCWLQNPDDRPTFSVLVKQLDEMLLSANDYIELDQYPNHDYYNIPKTAAPHELL